MEEAERASGSGEEWEEEGGSDSEGAPEDVSLARGKDEALRTHREASAQMRRVAASQKERRKRREELFTAQKEAKRERQQLVRFPVTDLKQVVNMRRTEVESQTAELKPKPKKITKLKKPKAERQILKGRQFGSVKVVALEVEGTQAVAAGHERALDFIQQQLYHGKRYKRVPILSFKAKKYTDRPASNFV